MNSVLQQKSSGQAWPLIGQPRLGASLLMMADHDQWPATVLFSGPSHLGKKVASRWFAQRDLCRSDRRPCRECQSCRAVDAGRHPDCISIFPKTGEFVRREDLEEQIRRLRWRRDGRGWVVIGDIDRLSEQTSTTLLKMIEEPPIRTNIVMTTSRYEAVLPTVRSRAVTYRWQMVSALELDKGILAAHPNLTAQQRRTVVARAEGRPGVALRLAAAFDHVDREWLEAQTFMTALGRGYTGERTEITEDDLHLCEHIVRDALLAYHIGRGRRWPEKTDTVRQFASKFTPDALLHIARRLTGRREYLRQHVQPSLFYHDLAL